MVVQRICKTDSYLYPFFFREAKIFFADFLTLSGDVDPEAIFLYIDFSILIAE